MNIIIHSGSFHSDEVTACALLEVFMPDTYTITRIGHQEPIPSNADYVIDIGREYDGEKLFDHHQHIVIPEEPDALENMSSAGLIWKYLGLSECYPKISNFIRLVDQHDVGIRKASSFEYPSIIASYNSDDIYDDRLQHSRFYEALRVAKMVITSMKKYQDDIDEVEAYLISRYDSLSEWEQASGVLISDRYLRGWDSFLNGELTPNLRCIIWPKDDGSTEWQGQVLPKKSGTYGLHGKGFEQSDKMIFVHANEFFCVAPNRDTMIDYLTDVPV